MSPAIAVSIIRQIDEALVEAPRLGDGIAI